MPFEIVRGDIAEMKADAIVDPADPRPRIGSGADRGIYKKAGPGLLAARKKAGDLSEGECAVTPAFGLDAKYVIHACGPVWRGGGMGEEALLRRCCRGALTLAAERGCASIAFPLLCAGNNGFPKELALSAAVDEFRAFLNDSAGHDMLITLAVFSGDVFRLSEKLYTSVAGYIDDNYVRDKLYEEYGIRPDASRNATTAKPAPDANAALASAMRAERGRRRGAKKSLFGKTAKKESSEGLAGFAAKPERENADGLFHSQLEGTRPNAAHFSGHAPLYHSAESGFDGYGGEDDDLTVETCEDAEEYSPGAPLFAASAEAPVFGDSVSPDWGRMLSHPDAGFSETLLRLIDRTGKKDSEIYKRANVDRKLFSKIRTNSGYNPSKSTAIAFALALELDLDGTKDLLSRAGYALSRSSKSDIIVEYFISHRNYNVFELNEVLFAFEQPCIGIRE